MNQSRREIICGLAAAGAAVMIGDGCDKSDRGAGESAPRAPGSAGGGAVTRPAPSVPTVSQLLIDGYPVAFPPARLRVQGTSPLSLVLFSGPEEKNGQAGGSFYFDITIDGVDDVAMLDGALWQQTAFPDRTDDLLTSIQIDAGAQQFQPQEITIAFSTDGQVVQAKLSGRWGLFARAEALLPERAVLVTGELVAGIDSQ